MRTIRRISLVTALAVGATACSDKSPSGPDSPLRELPAGMVVSNALSGSSIASLSAGSTSLATAGDNAAYVSAVPGTFPRASSVTIRNDSRNGPPTTASILDGGFDPIGIVAAEDDELHLTLTSIDGGTTSFRTKVPRRRPPVVVRTNPPKGRTDVALNVNVTIIFSEPVDKSTVTPTTLALSLHGNPVSGSVGVAPDGLSASFVPDNPLEPQQTYALVVGLGIRDLEGDSLAEPVSVSFTTAARSVSASRMVVTVVTKAVFSEWLDPDGYVVRLTGQPDHAVSINGSVTIENLPLGTYIVTLEGISATCTLDTPSPVQASVLAGLTAAVTFDVACGPSSDLEGMLAFVSERDGNSEIYTVRADGTGLVRLTNNAATDTDPAWSPDGQRILFVSNRDAGASEWESDIYVMEADGSNVVRLTYGARASAPAWSPDGQKFVSSQLKNGQVGIYVTSLDNLSASTNVAFPVGYQTDPAWSPDGKRIAFTSDARAYDFLYDLYVANLDGSGITPLILGPFFWNDGLRFYFQSAWSPDGQKIAVVTCGYAWDNCYPNSSIAIADADGSNETILVQTAGFASPTWSPDGKTIAYSAQSCRTCAGSIRYISLDGTRSGVIFSGGHSPSWKP